MRKRLSECFVFMHGMINSYQIDLQPMDMIPDKIGNLFPRTCQTAFHDPRGFKSIQLCNEVQYNPAMTYAICNQA